MNIIKLSLIPLFFIFSTPTYSSSLGTPYQPYNQRDLFNDMFGGYSDERTNQNTAIVRFDASFFSSSQEVRNFLLYRCAEVTINNGYSYFIIASSSTSPYVDHVKEHVNYHQYNTYPPRDYNSGYTTVSYESSDYGSTSMQPRCTNCGSHSAVAVIKMYDGERPAGVPNAYNAQDVIAHLGPETY